LEVSGSAAGVVGAVAAVIALKPVLVGEPEDRPVPPPPTFAFVDPRSGTVTKMPCSFEVHGEGAPPAGKNIAVANQESNERYYFESAVNVQEGEWSAAIEVGTSETPAGSRFHLSAVLLDAVWEHYLGGVTDEEEATYWSSEGLPPGANVVATAEIETKEQCKD
jgi:hypothetical protein